jgi:hypothetical protein
MVPVRKDLRSRFWFEYRSKVAESRIIAAFAQQLMKLSHIASVFALLTLVMSLRAAETGDRMLQQELKQQQLKTTTERVGIQLDAIIDEFNRNGIAGQDVTVLRTIRNVLGTLSEEDMKLVLSYLQSSRQAAEPNASAKQATEAYGRQKMIITKLKALEAEYRRQAQLYEISIRLRELANRQSANMWLGVWLDKTTGSKPINSFDEGSKNNLKLQEIDQENIKDEVLLVLTRLDKLSKEAQDGPTAKAPREAVGRVENGGVKDALQDALKDLRESRVLSAIGNEKRARDQLREVSRMLVLSEDQLELLRQALRELEQAIDQQKQVSTKTKAIEQKDDAAKAETSQAEVMDSTDLVSRDIDNLAPIATEHLRRAMDSMQVARSTLSANDDIRRKREKAPPTQADALASLEQGRRALLEQLAKAEAEAGKPENKLAELKQLLERLQQLVKDEEKLRDETAAADKNSLPAKARTQGELKDTAQELQETAGGDSPAAAESIGEAAEQMQKAQNSLANAQNNTPAQQAAIDALKKAEQQLSQDIAKLEQAEKDLASLDELLEKLAKVIDEQQQVESKTADEATKPESRPLKDLASKQDQLGNDTAGLEQKAGSAAPTAAERLAEAKEHMADAKKELDKPAAKDAQPDQREALRDLYAAKREIEDQMDKLRDMLGRPPEDSSLADAASMIEQAQREVNEAMEQMEAGALPPAGKNLNNAENLVSPLTAGKKGRLPPSAQSALESAQGALSSGSAQAAAGQGAPAEASAAAASEALAQAQAALALAQAGLSSGMAQGQGQGQGKGQGQGRGQGKGQGQGDPAPQGTGRQGNWRGSGGADGPKRGTVGQGQFTKLPARDRAAIQQSQGEKYPQEYGPLVEQYLKNLSDQGTGK